MKNKNKNEKKKNTNENKSKNKNKNENENKNRFWFSFSFPFLFLLLLSKRFCILVNSTWPRGAIHGAIQLSLDWPTSGIAFLLTARSPKVHFRLRIFHVA